MASFSKDPQLMQWLAQAADNDPSADVQAACVGAVVLAHHHGMSDLVFYVYERHAQSQNEPVRKKVAENVSSLPKNPQRVWGIVQRLLADPSEEVRRSMAWQFCNMSQFKELLPLLQHAAENDPSEEVRNDALYGMGTMLPAPQLAHYYRAHLQRRPSEALMHSVLSGCREHMKDPMVRQLVIELSGVGYTGVADRAREALTQP
jgi:hypothetical protein